MRQYGVASLGLRPCARSEQINADRLQGFQYLLERALQRRQLTPAQTQVDGLRRWVGFRTHTIEVST